MENFLKGIIGVIALIIGVFAGKLLAKFTPEELESGQKWFFWITLVCLFGSLFGLFSQNDFVLFSSLFIGIVTSGSFLKRKIKIKRLKNKK